MNNAAPGLYVQTKEKKIPTHTSFFSILNVVEQVAFSLIPEEEKGSANL